MSFEIDRKTYAQMFGATTGDSVRLGDTNLWAKVEKDLTVYGQEAELLQMKEGENALLVKLMAQDENRNTCRFAKIIVQSHSVLHYMKGIV